VNKLESYIDKYKDLGAQEAADLESLVRMYPWFHGAHVLLAKSHKNQNRFSQKSLLKKASLYAGDRSILYQIMQDNWDQNQKGNEVVPQLIEEKPETEVIKEEMESVASINETVESPDTIPEAIDKETEKVEDSAAESDLQTESNQEVEEESAVSQLEEAIQYDPIEALKEFQTEEDESTQSPEQDLSDLIPDKPPYNPEKELLKLIEGESGESNVDKNDSSEVEQPHDFGFWLDHFSEEETDDKQNDTFKSENKPLTEEGSSHSTDKVVDLLDQFIKTKPKIKRQEREFFNAEKQGLKSVEDSSDIVTETLAKLFLKQGHPSRAVDVYEKLRLQNPEKDAYFARLIEEIETE